MAKLTAEEQSLLKKLTDKAKAPEDTPVGKSLNITLDLGNEKAVALARKFGLLPNDEEEEEETEGKEEEEGEETPKRKGFFTDK